MTDGVETTLRNASLQDLAKLLETQREAKRDVVVPADMIRSEDGELIVPAIGSELTVDGVSTVDGRLRPTPVCDETIAAKLEIPVKYLRSVRERGLTVPSEWSVRYAEETGDTSRFEPHRLALIDAMLNAHFADHKKNVLVRSFTYGDGTGIARAMLSNRYMPIDNLDVLYTTLEAARSVSTDVEVYKIDLSERYMRVFLVAPQVTALAPRLLDGYRPPEVNPNRPDLGFGTSHGRPIVFAGLRIDNSETGGGKYRVTPYMVVQICSNGLTMTKDAVEQVHVGGQLETGLIEWSADTQRKNLELISAKTRDAVSTFLDTAYMEKAITSIEEKAPTPIEKPEETIRVVATKLRYTESERETLLSHFIRGGQGTAGGVLNAVTSMAQTIEDPDRAAEIEASGLDALALAASN